MGLVIRVPEDLRKRIEAVKLGEETTGATARRLIKNGLRCNPELKPASES